MTAMTHIKKTDVEGNLPGAGIRAGADSGNPVLNVQALEHITGSNVGIWECQPGGWPVVDRTDTEVCYILTGAARITDESSGDVREVTAGDLVVLPVGWTGRWDITETVRKVYAIY